MAADLLHILRSIGLNEKESALYLVGLSLGSAPASAYAKAAKLNRITAYNALEGLARRGLLTVSRTVRAKGYAPVPPEHLAIEARKNADALQRVLPELRSLQGKDRRRPVIRFFHYCLAVLLERFVFFLNRMNSQGDVMAESR
ncbi:MAG: helix-turn-helix domain-containing protein, partial [Candidatus Peregrinibacteria bacterium]